MRHSDQSSEERQQDTKQLSNENNTVRAEGQPTDPPKRSSYKENRWWKELDQSLVATLALAVISLCALFVSIYQTRVLSLQQEVMAEQQRIMTESAKAQLWPNVDLGIHREVNDDTLTKIDFEVSNTGTGPAIVDGVNIKYKGQYVRNVFELLKLTNLDTAFESLSTSQLSHRVIQAGEEFDFLSITGKKNTLLDSLNSELDEGSMVITVCFRSTFNEYWLLTDTIGSYSVAQRVMIDSCSSTDKTMYLN